MSTFLRNKKTCFLALGEVPWRMNISTSSRKHTEAKTQHWDASGKSKLLNMQTQTLLRSRSWKWCLLPQSHSWEEQLLEKRSKHMASVTSRDVSVANPKSKIDRFFFFSSPKIFVHVNHPQLCQITRQLKLHLIIFRYNHNEQDLERCVSRKYILFTTKCFVKGWSS